MADNQIEVLLKLNDEFSANFKKAVSDLEGGSSRAKSSTDKTQSSMVALGASVVAVTAGIYTLKKAFDFATGAGIPFQANMSKLGAISGASEKELKALEKTAKTLGENSRNSASQVAELQIELSKLGFTADQINLMAEGINNLSIATGEDLKNSSEAVGATIRQFNLDASEATRVVDVMSASFSSSSLDLNKYQIAMGQLGPTANSMNFSLEETTAVLGKIVDTGIRSETAATGLRNIFGELRTENGKLSKTLGGPIQGFDDLIQGLQGVEVGSAKYFQALEDVGKENQAVFISLLNNKNALKDFSQELIDSEGKAQNMASTMSDNVDGALANMNSALEALGINLFEAFDDQYQVFLQNMTVEIKELSQWVIQNSDIIGNWAEQVFRGVSGAVKIFNSLKNLINEVNYVAQIIMLPFKNAISVIGALSKTAFDFFESLFNLDFDQFGNKFQMRLNELNESVLQNAEDVQIAYNNVFNEDTASFLAKNEKKATAMIRSIKKVKREVEKPIAQEAEIIGSKKSSSDIDKANEQKKAEELKDLESQLEIKNLLSESEFDRLMNEEKFLKDSLDRKLINEKEYARKTNKIDALIQKNKRQNQEETYNLGKKALESWFGDNKIVASGIALADTYMAANKALASAPPPFSYINAGLATAFGLGNVAKINGVKGFNRGGIVGGLGTSDSVDAILTPGEGVLNKQATNRIGAGTVEALNNNNIPTKTIANNVTYAPVINLNGSNDFSLSKALASDKEGFARFFKEEIMEKGYV